VTIPFSALSKFLRVVKADIEREKKGKAGVENLARALQETPKFGSEDSQQDVQEKLQHMRSMLTFLEACRCARGNSTSSILFFKNCPKNAQWIKLSPTFAFVVV
jgi:hypothetical protein